MGAEATLKIFEIFLVRRVWVSFCVPNHRDFTDFDL